MDFKNQHRDVVAGSYYDSFKFASGGIVPSRIEMFREPVSNHRSFVDTNMAQCNILPPPNELCINRLVISIPRVVHEADIMNFITNYTIQLWIGDKLYIRENLLTLPMHRGQINLSPIRKCKSCLSCYVELKCPSCGSPEFELFGAHDPTNPEYSSNVMRFVFECSVPLVIQCQQYFRVFFEGNSFTLGNVSEQGRGIMAWVNLEGLIARRIQ